MAGEHGGVEPAPSKRQRSALPRNPVPAEPGRTVRTRPAAKATTAPKAPTAPKALGASMAPTASKALTAATAPTAATATPAPLPRTTHRQLVTRGLDPAEAANLVAFLNGLPVGAHTWSLREINRLLFLRDMAHRAGWEH